MKIWKSFGSEHSANLVMIGCFKSVADATKTQKIIDTLTVELSRKEDLDNSTERFDDDVLELLRRTECFSLAPHEISQFQFSFNSQVKDNKIILTTEEYEVSAFLKLMIDNGAKVEIFSAHNYPDAEYGRGK